MLSCAKRALAVPLAAEVVTARRARPRTPSWFQDGPAAAEERVVPRGLQQPSATERAAATGGFAAHKERVLQRTLLNDHSPRGGVDPRVVDIVEEINRRESLVTTSSCSGRVLLISLRGQRTGPPAGGAGEELAEADQAADVPLPSVRSTTGRWRISHDGIEDAASYFCLETSPLREHREHVWLAVQPFDLHVACATSAEASRLLAVARPAFPRAAVIAPAGVPHRWGGGGGGDRASRTVVAIQGDQRLEMPFVVAGQQVYSGCLSTLAGIVNRKLEKNWAAMHSFLELLRKEL